MAAIEAGPGPDSSDQGGQQMKKLMRLVKRVAHEEKGITGLETAIILIAFVVVATVFAFVVLSTGLFSSERGKEAVYSGLQKTEGSLELRGSVIAVTTNGAISKIIFDVANAAAGEPVNLDPAATSNKMVVDYRDANVNVADVPWTVNWIVPPQSSAPNNLLQEGKLAEIDIDVSTLTDGNGTAVTLGANQAFTLEVKPPLGGTMVIARTTPAGLDAVVDLH